MNDHRKVLIIEADFYPDITGLMLKGAMKELDDAGIDYKHVKVPGALEIPAAMRYAVRSMEMKTTDTRYIGYIVIGCVIKGDTDHYDHVCREAMHGVSTLASQFSLAVGNAILTVHDEKQALERAKVDKINWGGKAAKACIRMIDLKKLIGL